MACALCEVLPTRLSGPLDVYISAPLATVEERIRAAFAAEQIQAQDLFNGIRRYRVSAQTLETVCSSGLSSLSDRAKRDTRALIVTPDTNPTIRNLVHMKSLDGMIAEVEGGGIIEMLEAKRLETWFQPIVSVEDRSLFAYECLSRGRDAEDNIIRPDHMFGVARRSNLLYYLDRDARITAIRGASRLGLASKIFINFNPVSIYSPETCLQTTIEELESSNLDADQVVFEIVESDRVRDIGQLTAILDHYRSRNFKVALDDLGAGFNSLTSLDKLRPDYMKLDLELTRNVDSDPYKARICENLLALADKLGVESIVEGIETPDEYRWIRDHGAKYVQGYLIARPAPEPPEPDYSWMLT
ncbi:MAG: EAL domain-containing protein [Spirochaetaceae bacterium]